MARDKLVDPKGPRMNFDIHLFTPEAKDIVHSQNRTIISRLGETP